MSGNVVYVGIDVDDVQYHGSALDRQTGEVLSFQCRPTLKGLIGQLDNVRKHFGGIELKLCYEASYVGFSLQRDLADRGYPCEVVSPSSIPRRAGKSVKTDRIDAAELAEYYANGLLSVVAEPEAEVEQDRDLLRSRQRLIQQLFIQQLFIQQQGICSGTFSHCCAATACMTRPSAPARHTGGRITVFCNLGLAGQNDRGLHGQSEGEPVAVVPTAEESG